MDETLLKQLSPYQTDHLILLVGTNPLPNYVAAQLLLRPGGKVHLLCSAETQKIAERLRDALRNLSLASQVHPRIDEGLPSDIFGRTDDLIDQLGRDARIGLHYTGGTKAMAVHAYRAAEGAADNIHPIVFSYLDARKMALILDDQLNDGRDLEIPVARAVNLRVAEIAALHNITFRNANGRRMPAKVVDELWALHGTDGWHDWTKKNLYRDKSPDKFRPTSELKTLRAPSASIAGHLPGVFKSLGANAAEATLEDWARVAGFEVNQNGMESFARQIAGGYWLEDIVARALEESRFDCQLADIGMNLEPDRVGGFEFDVAATQGYRLYGISCTTAGKEALCKSKLVEAFHRARQLGGDEARVALVCGSDDPNKVHAGFTSSNYVSPNAVRVFGKQSWKTLARDLKEWMNR